MQIEYPEFPPVALGVQSGPATIGEFYNEIIAALRECQPKILPGAHSIPVILANPIRTIADAVATIERVKEEGEGVEDSPKQPTAEGPDHAHYYLFKEVHRQRRLIYTGGKWRFEGAKLTFPEVYEFEKAACQNPAVCEFRKTLTHLLCELEACWHRGAPLNVATMFELRQRGQGLIRSGIQPEFKWLSPA